MEPSDSTAIFVDGYRIRGVLGQGGMARVYLAEHLGLRRQAALKVFDRQALDETEAQRFLGEARALASLSHPATVPLLDYGETDDCLYLVTPHMAAGSLRDRIGKHGPVDPVCALRWVVRLAEALEVIHGRGIIHRDIKPANILFDNSDQPVLIDFGVIRSSEHVSVRTISGEILGTLEYLAPEIILGEDPTVSSDIFALGLVLYEMVTGLSSRPRLSSLVSDEDLARFAQNHQPPSVLGSNRDLPASLDGPIGRATAFEPGDRPKTATVWIGELRSLLFDLSPGDVSSGAMNIGAIHSPDHPKAPSTLPPDVSVEVPRSRSRSYLVGSLVALALAFLPWLGSRRPIIEVLPDLPRPSLPDLTLRSSRVKVKKASQELNDGGFWANVFFRPALAGELRELDRNLQDLRKAADARRDDRILRTKPPQEAHQNSDREALDPASLLPLLTRFVTLIDSIGSVDPDGYTGPQWLDMVEVGLTLISEVVRSRGQAPSSPLAGPLTGLESRLAVPRGTPFKKGFAILLKSQLLFEEARTLDKNREISETQLRYEEIRAREMSRLISVAYLEAARLLDTLEPRVKVEFQIFSRQIWYLDRGIQHWEQARENHPLPGDAAGAFGPSLRMRSFMADLAWKVDPKEFQRTDPRTPMAAKILFNQMSLLTATPEATPLDQTRARTILDHVKSLAARSGTNR